MVESKDLKLVTKREIWNEIKEDELLVRLVTEFKPKEITHNNLTWRMK